MLAAAAVAPPEKSTSELTTDLTYAALFLGMYTVFRFLTSPASKAVSSLVNGAAKTVQWSLSSKWAFLLTVGLALLGAVAVYFIRRKKKDMDAEDEGRRERIRRIASGELQDDAKAGLAKKGGEWGKRASMNPTDAASTETKDVMSDFVKDYDEDLMEYRYNTQIHDNILKEAASPDKQEQWKRLFALSDKGEIMQNDVDILKKYNSSVDNPASARKFLKSVRALQAVDVAGTHDALQKLLAVTREDTIDIEDLKLALLFENGATKEYVESRVKNLLRMVQIGALREKKLGGLFTKTFKKLTIDGKPVTEIDQIDEGFIEEHSKLAAQSKEDVDQELHQTYQDANRAATGDLSSSKSMQRGKGRNLLKLFKPVK